MCAVSLEVVPDRILWCTLALLLSITCRDTLQVLIYISAKVSVVDMQGLIRDDLNLLEEFTRHPDARLAIKEAM
jgi:hypothetical protein